MKVSKVVVAALAALAIAGCEAPQSEDIEKVTSRLTFGNCNIPSTDICVCTEANGLGTCGDLNGFQRFFMNLSTASGLTQLNDTITSIAVGAQARGKICADPGGNGACGYLQPGQIIADLGAGLGCPGHTTCTSGLNFGWGCKCLNNNITSIRVDQNSFDCSNPGAEQASIFEDTNFNNGMIAPSGNSHDCVVLRLGDVLHYPNPFTNAIQGETGGGFGLNTDVISSVKLGPGTLMDLFADPSFKGATIELTSSSPNLATLTPNLNDKVSSLTVF